MYRFIVAFLLGALLCVPAQRVLSQEAPSDTANGEKAPVSARDTAKEIVNDTQQSVDKIADEVNQNQRAQQASSSILKPIYKLAEYMSFSAFHWLAFAIMVTGVVSFALQLVLAKLVVLAKSSLSLTEVLSDALGLVISVIGLVLTTQAATENSHFTESAFAVLTATAVGALAGLVFYWWGQRQEVQAVKGRQQAQS